MALALPFLSAAVSWDKKHRDNLTCKRQNFQQYLFWRHMRNISVAQAAGSVCDRFPAFSGYVPDVPGVGSEMCK